MCNGCLGLSKLIYRAMARSISLFGNRTPLKFALYRISFSYDRFIKCSIAASSIKLQLDLSDLTEHHPHDINTYWTLRDRCHTGTVVTAPAYQITKSRYHRLLGSPA